jgi:SPP1 family predicted phage head-tail adaptor
MFNVGSFKDRVVFVNHPAKPHAGVGYIDNPTTALTTRGMLKFDSSTSFLSEGQNGFNNTYKLYVRYQSALDSLIKKNNQIVVNDTKYTISDYEMLNMEHKYVVFTIKIVEKWA